MKITVGALTPDDRQEWETLYRGYAEFYQVPMTSEILDTVWSWIFEEDYGFYALVANNGIIVKSASCTSGKCPHLYEEKRLVF